LREIPFGATGAGAWRATGPVGGEDKNGQDGRSLITSGYIIFYGKFVQAKNLER
jgi:hypothetical protein